MRNKKFESDHYFRINYGFGKKTYRDLNNTPLVDSDDRYSHGSDYTTISRRDARGTRRPRPCPPPGGAREVARRRPGRPGARSWHRCRRCRPGCAGGPADARWLPTPMSRLGATTTPFPTRASARGQISERATPLSRSGLPEGALPPIPGSGRPHGRRPCRTGPPHIS